MKITLIQEALVIVKISNFVIEMLVMDDDIISFS